MTLVISGVKKHLLELTSACMFDNESVYIVPNVFLYFVVFKNTLRSLATVNSYVL